MKKIYLVAYDLNPNRGSEAGRASAWLDTVSRHYSMEVYTDAFHQKDISSKAYSNTSFHFIEGTRFRRWLRHKTSIPFGPHFFLKKVREELAKHDSSDCIFLHCLTPAGIHSYNDLYKLGIPIIIGPLGGGLKTPPGFSQAFDHQRITTILRELFFKLLKRNTGWRNYLLNAKMIILGLGIQEDWLPEGAMKNWVRIPDAVVDVNFFIPPSNKPANDLVRVLFSGRLISSKGVVLLLEAIKKCIDAGVDNLITEIAGVGGLQGRMEKLIRYYGIQKYVIFLGQLTKNEMLFKYQGSDIFCLPTLREPGGTAILEAMACGLPIITSNYGGPALTVTSDCGIKIDLKNYDTYLEDLTKALKYLIRNPEVRQTMGVMGRQRVANEFSLEALERKILKCYQQAIALVDGLKSS